MEAIKIPVAIKELRLKKLEVEKVAVERTRALEAVKAEITEDVLCEVGGDGKKLYTNDASRRAAIEISLTTNNNYQEALFNLQLASCEVKKLDIDLEYTYNMLKLHIAQNCPFATR